MCSQSLRISQWIANLAMWFAKLAKWLRVWQGDCEFGKAIANLAMRNFAKLLKFYVRSEVRKCTVNVVSEFRNAN